MDNSERMERVNELAAQAKTDNSIIPELWSMVEQLIHVVCRRYCCPENGNRICDFDDLCQNAYFGFIKAIEAYDPERGAFSTILVYHVRHSCRAEIGLRGKRDALFDANTLNGSVSHEDDGSLTLIDTLTDPGAEQPFEDTVEQVYTAQLRAALDFCMKQIPKTHAHLIRARFYERTTLDVIAAKYGCNSREAARQEIEKALKKMRCPDNMALLEPYYQGVAYNTALKSGGLASFKNNWYSCVEFAVEKLIEKNEAANNVLDKIFSLSFGAGDGMIRREECKS